MLEYILSNISLITPSKLLSLSDINLDNVFSPIVYLLFTLTDLRYGLKCFKNLVQIILFRHFCSEQTYLYWIFFIEAFAGIV